MLWAVTGFRCLCGGAWPCASLFARAQAFVSAVGVGTAGDSSRFRAHRFDFLGGGTRWGWKLTGSSVYLSALGDRANVGEINCLVSLLV